MAPMTAMRTIIGSIPPRSASRLINLESTSFLNNASLRAACDFFRAAESAFGLGSSSAEPEVGALFFWHNVETGSKLARPQFNPSKSRKRSKRPPQKGSARGVGALSMPP